jgi:hypothetical protein
MELVIPEYNITVVPGSVIKIGRFNRELWVVGYGWYSWGGNRPVCGWYLTNELSKEVKPLYYTDLEDTYMVE